MAAGRTRRALGALAGLALVAAVPAGIVGSPAGAAPSRSIVVDDPTAVEGRKGTTSTALFTLSLSTAPGPGRSVTVTVATRDGTARAGADYTAVPATRVRFGPGERTRTVRVDVLGDGRAEGAETVRLRLTNARGAVLGDSRGVATITDPVAMPRLAFRDTTELAGLGTLDTAYAHAAAWGDVDGDGHLDLFVGTFPNARSDGQAPSPSRLFLGTGDGFVTADQPVVELGGRASGAVLADLDGDGDLDLYVSNNRKVTTPPQPALLEPSRLFRNDAGAFEDATSTSGIDVADRNGRAVGVLDHDGDGLLDLFVVADSLTGEGPRVSRLLRNLGGLRFEDATAAAGLPTDLAGLGVAAGDVNGDGWPDLVVTGGVTASGSYARTYLFVNDGSGRFRDASTPNLAWTPLGAEDWTSGADLGDLNRDGRMDLVVTHHFSSAASTPRAPRVYLNDGNTEDGLPVLTEVLDGDLTPIPTKAPHIEIVDVDNDGWPDIYTSVLLTTDRGPMPWVALRTPGDGLAFEPPIGSVVSYAPGGPTADYDGDGRLDVLLEGLGVDVAPSLLQNVTPAGHWLAVEVRDDGPNHHGVGARVSVYRAGHAGEPGALLGVAELGTGNGYSSASPIEARFGLGGTSVVDVVVTLPFGGPTRTWAGVAADRVITLAV